jgi:hypothetical protein
MNVDGVEVRWVRARRATQTGSTQAEKFAEECDRSHPIHPGRIAVRREAGRDHKSVRLDRFDAGVGGIEDAAIDRGARRAPAVAAPDPLRLQARS